MRALVVAVTLLSCPLLGSIAHADTRAEAVALFDQGHKEMKAGNFEKACKSFAQSNALVPDTGTKGSLAKCYEKSGKLASSWLLWRELADTAPSADLRKDAAAQAAKLEARIPKYVVKVAKPTPGLVVTINGKAADFSIDVPVPIDAGPVTAQATAPGFQDWKGDSTATEGNTLVVEIPALTATAADKIIQKGVCLRDCPDDRAKRRHKRHLIGGTVVGLGLGSVVVGGVFGVMARGKFSDAKSTCGGSIDQCAPGQLDRAQGQVDDARSAATLSSILFAAGGALVVTGAVIWISAPSAQGGEHRSGVAIVPSLGGFVVSGRF